MAVVVGAVAGVSMEPFKNSFNLGTVNWIADTIERVYPAFERSRFLAIVEEGFEELELTPRGRRVAEALRATLPDDPAAAIEVLIASLPPFDPETRLKGLDAFRYLPHTAFVSTYGLDCFAESMRAQYLLTQHFTAEASIRAFIEAEPVRTMAQLREWASDPSEHVRRLVSEGTRPRLPWSPRLKSFQRDPEPVIALLELLKDDPSDYVRRSVANNLNDIAKDHPARVLELCAAWMVDASREREAIVRHALRSQIKAGDAQALAIVGASHGAPVAVRNGSLAPGTVEIGGAVRILFDVVNTGSDIARYVIDYRVHFVKANGTTSAKTFKLAVATLGAGEERRCSILRSVAPRTTRVHYAGTHRVDAVVNGVEFPLGAFELVGER